MTSVLVPSQATLDCDGGARATGYLSKVAKPACALAGKGTVTAIATEHRGTRLCHEGYGGPQRATITGKIGGQRVSVTIDRADGCGIDDWNRLRPLLGAPERRGAIPRRKASASAPTTTTTAAPATYLVQRGDTLTNIAKQFHTSVGAIVATNHLENPDALTEGQQLTMPPPSAVRIDAELVDGGGDTAHRTDPGRRRTFGARDVRRDPARRQHVHRVTALDVDLRRRHDDLQGDARHRQLLRHRHRRAAARPQRPPSTSSHPTDPTDPTDPPGIADEP